MARDSMTRLLGTALVALPLVAVAAGEGERPAFDEADANGDGKVSLEEAKQAGVPKAEAKREDIDDDNQLSKADWKFVDMSSGQTGEGSS